MLPASRESASCEKQNRALGRTCTEGVRVAIQNSSEEAGATARLNVWGFQDPAHIPEKRECIHQAGKRSRHCKSDYCLSGERAKPISPQPVK
jgi:hypothetical protein